MTSQASLFEAETAKTVGDITSSIAALGELPTEDRIEAINSIKRALHSISPFQSEPVDCVLWVKSEGVVANDYNPNSVAPPEMELLKVSILESGYTQPIVTFKTDGHYEVVDGFHRNRVGRECKEVFAHNIVNLTSLRPRVDGKLKGARLEHEFLSGKQDYKR